MRRSVKRRSPQEPARIAAGPGVASGRDRLTAAAGGVLFGLALGVADRLLFSPRAKGRFSAAGRRADSPTELPASSWRDVVRRTWTEFNSDHIPAVAGGATFFALLALFPALGVFVSLYGLFGDVEQARLQLVQLQGVLPQGAIMVLSEQITRLAAAPHGRLGATFVLGLLLSLWSTNAGVKALIAGLNVAYEEKERRNFLRLNLVSLSFTVGGIAVGLAAAAAATLTARLDLAASPVLAVLRWPLGLAVVVVMLALLYRYAPSRAHAKWRWITPGSVLAALCWLGMSLLFTTYVANFGHYDKTYGSLGALVGFMTWIWLSLAVILLGAELNSELEQHTAADTTTGPPRAPGVRGAAAADRSPR